MTKRATVREYATFYHGVIRDRQGWAGYVRIGGRRVAVGTFADPSDAALARDRVLIGLGDEKSPLNFPRRKLLPATVQEMRTWARQRRKRESDPHHPYVGIRRLPLLRQRWMATLMVGAKTYFLGNWASAKKAALARDRAVLYYRQEPSDLNFPRQAHLLQPADAQTLRREAWAEYKTTTSSRFRGVSWNSDGYEVHLRVKGERYNLGCYADEHDAARAYDRAARKLLGSRARLNFPDRNRRGR
jgi:hypothetical protein